MRAMSRLPCSVLLACLTLACASERSDEPKQPAGNDTRTATDHPAAL